MMMMSKKKKKTTKVLGDDDMEQLKERARAARKKFVLSEKAISPEAIGVQIRVLPDVCKRDTEIGERVRLLVKVGGVLRRLE